MTIWRAILSIWQNCSIMLSDAISRPSYSGSDSVQIQVSWDVWNPTPNSQLCCRLRIWTGMPRMAKTANMAYSLYLELRASTQYGGIWCTGPPEVAYMTYIMYHPRMYDTGSGHMLCPDMVRSGVHMESICSRMTYLRIWVPGAGTQGEHHIYVYVRIYDVRAFRVPYAVGTPSMTCTVYVPYLYIQYWGVNSHIYGIWVLLDTCPEVTKTPYWETSNVVSSCGTIIW